MNDIREAFSRFTKSFKNPVERLNLAFVGTLLILGAATIVICKFSDKDLSKNVSNLKLPIAALVALCCFAAGSLVGFLFGIPRALQAASNSGTTKNTSLEQISDWLTKIIVGVGLTQFGSIRDAFNSTASNIGKALIQNDKLASESTVVAGTIIILFSILGFLMTYLWTRLFLDRIEQTDAETVIKKVDDSDRAARDLATEQLNGTNIGAKKLYEEFQKASGNAITNIYILAENTVRGEDRIKIGNAIPIFEALILLDSKLDYPENFVQLGISYFKKEPPDYANALSRIDKAVEVYKSKSPQPRIGLLLYHRALSRLFLLNTTLDDANKKLIIEDLKEASTEHYVLNQMKKDANEAGFEKLNEILREMGQLI